MADGPGPKRKRREAEPISLYPLSLDDALRGAMLTGPPPETPKRTRKPKADATPAVPLDAGREEAAEQVRAAGRKAGEKARQRKRQDATGKRGSTSEG